MAVSSTIGEGAVIDAARSLVLPGPDTGTVLAVDVTQQMQPPVSLAGVDSNRTAQLLSHPVAILAQRIASSGLVASGDTLVGGGAGDLQVSRSAVGGFGGTSTGGASRLMQGGPSTNGHVDGSPAWEPANADPLLRIVSQSTGRGGVATASGDGDGGMSSSLPPGTKLQWIDDFDPLLLACVPPVAPLIDLVRSAVLARGSGSIGVARDASRAALREWIDVA